MELSREDLKEGTVYKAVGCEKCSNTGYSGRTTISELIPVTENIRSLILSGSDSNTIKEEAAKEGMVSIRYDAISKVLNGITTIEELFRTTQTD